jgi:hypothetical protein
MALKSKSAGSGKRKFVYNKPSDDAIKRRSTESAGVYDQLFNDGITEFKPKEGRNRIRILPATWEDATDMGMPCFIHYSVGPDNQKYWSISRMSQCAELQGIEDTRDAIADEIDAAIRRGEPQKYIDGLKPARKMAVYLIDRKNEDAGPQVWHMPISKVWKEIGKRSQDRRTGEVLYVDDPADGYDIEFDYEKKGAKGEAIAVEYSGIDLDRRPSPLSDDEEQADKWLDFIVENPLPMTFKFYDYEHVEKQLISAPAEDEGKSKSKPEVATRHKPAAAKPKPQVEEEEEEMDELIGGEEEEEEVAAEEEEEEVAEEEAEEEEAPRSTIKDRVRAAVPAAKGKSVSKFRKP